VGGSERYVPVRHADNTATKGRKRKTAFNIIHSLLSIELFDNEILLRLAIADYYKLGSRYAEEALRSLQVGSRSNVVTHSSSRVDTRPAVCLPNVCCHFVFVVNG